MQYAQPSDVFWRLIWTLGFLLCAITDIWPPQLVRQHILCPKIGFWTPELATGTRRFPPASFVAR